jgi:hypothetical protein
MFAMPEDVARVVAANARANDADALREIELARASEAAATATLRRIAMEAASPVWPIPDAAPKRAPPAPAPPAVVASPRMPRSAPAVEPMSSAALVRSFQNQGIADTWQPVLYGRASPSLTRLLRSRGQTPLNPPEGSYYLPPSAAWARRVARPLEEEEADTYTGKASASMRHMLAMRGQRPADDFR